jgi:hypothetical protein
MATPKKPIDATNPEVAKPEPTLNIITGVTYFKLTPSEDADTYWLNPYDSNGNLFQVVTIEIDSTNSQAYINMPFITPNIKSIEIGLPTLNGNQNITVNIILTIPPTDFAPIINPVYVNLGGYQVPLNTNNSSIVCKPISNEAWSYVNTIYK